MSTAKPEFRVGQVWRLNDPPSIDTEDAENFDMNDCVFEARVELCVPYKVGVVVTMSRWHEPDIMTSDHPFMVSKATLRKVGYLVYEPGDP
jgi:hypothetical protein